VVVGLHLDIEKAPHRNDNSLHDFLVCAQVETKEWNGIKERKKVHSYKPN
jgi:hypothetical protein